MTIADAAQGLFLGLALCSLATPGKPDGNEIRNPLLAYSLTGVVLTREGAGFSAILKNSATGESEVLGEGESWKRFVLAKVLKAGAVFQKGEHCLRIHLDRTLTSPPVDGRQPPFLPAASSQSGDSSPRRFSTAGPDIISREFKRADIEKRLREEMPVIYQETQFFPNIVGGRIRGFRITQLPPRTLISEVGIRMDDILLEINGTPLNDMGHLFGLNEQLRNGKALGVLIERNGHLIRALYLIN